MRRTILALSFLAAAAVLSLAALPHANAQGPGGAGGPGGPGGPGGRGGMRPGGGGFGAMAPDSFQADRDSLVGLVMERIKGHESEPAEKVFKNVKVMQGRTAEQLVRGMNGMGRSLGVPCAHCHIENHWADDDKQPKRICREMIQMMPALNDTVLARVTLDHPGDHPHVGCFTCHRGHANPNFGMGRPPGGGPRGEGGPRGDGGPRGEGGPRGGDRPNGDQH